MSFPAYDEYKDSGVECIGRMPIHWDVFPLKRDLNFITSGSRGWAGNYSDEGELFIRIGNLTRDKILLDLSDVQRVDVPDGTEGLRTKVQPGDVLFSVTAYLGSVAVVPETIEPAYVSQHVALTRLRQDRILPAWAAYVSLSIVGTTWFDTKAYGGTKIQLSLDDVRDFLMPIPPLNEQQAIASFLDAETAKIDGLVSEQRRLIELLKEKRQAVISHAVTRGLNPNVPMKPSGIPWLGDVPAHWEVVRLGRLCDDVGDGPHFSPKYVEEDADGVLFLSARNIKVDKWDFDDIKFVSAEDCDDFDRRIVPEAGDVLYTKGGTTGVARVVDLPMRFQVWVHVAVLKIKKKTVLPDYVALALNSTGSYEQSQLYTRGATNQDLGLTRMVKIMLGLPPIKEQPTIIEYLDTETRRIDSLLAEAERAIALLQERRTALISAAVTGKIDVRGFARKGAVG